MPTYIFKNTKTDEIFEKQMRISELDEFKKENPDLIQMPTAPSFRLKGQDGMKQTLKQETKKILLKAIMKLSHLQSLKKKRNRQQKKYHLKRNEKNT